MCNTTEAVEQNQMNNQGNDIACGQTEGLHHLGLSVENIHQSAAFFEQELGFKRVAEKPDYPAIFISDGHIMLTLWQLQVAEEQMQPFNRHANAGLHHFAIKLKNTSTLNALFERFLVLPNVSVEFAPEPLSNTPFTHGMAVVPGGLRVEFIASAA